MTGGWLERGFARAPDAPAVVCGATSLTFAELLARRDRLAAGLAARLRPGDRVAVVAANGHRYLELYLAVPHAGLVLVPLDPGWPAERLRGVIDDAGVALVFADPDLARLAGPPLITLDGAYESLIASTGPATPSPSPPPETVAALLYTGGTTSEPKGVMLTHANLDANARNIEAALDLTAGTCWLIATPMFHVSGTIGALATLGAGGRQVILERFDARAALELVDRHAVTTTLVVPPMLAALAAEQDARPRRLPSLRLISHGGGPVTPVEVERAHAGFPSAELVHLYGATELSPIATVLRDEQAWIGQARGRSCGRPVGDVAIEVRGPDDDPLPRGEIGEIVVRGPIVMHGYWRRPAATAAALRDGWYRTGDVGMLDQDGLLHVLDRVLDVIDAPDGPLYSTAVERALRRVPRVREAAALPATGGGVDAFVVVEDPHDHAVRDGCHAVLTGLTPAFTVTLRTDPLPRSGAGKVFKRGLRRSAGAGDRRAQRPR